MEGEVGARCQIAHFNILRALALARALVKLVFPGGGMVISAAMAGAATYALGEAAIAYFIYGKSPKESKDIYELEMKKKEGEGSEK
jgi:uncharacterized protein (DUF697 family)